MATFGTLTIEQKDELVALYSLSTDAELDSKAKSFGVVVKLATLQREIRRYNETRRQILGEVANKADSIPSSPKRRMLDYPIIATDNAIIISDIEIPDHNADMLKLAFWVGVNMGIRTCIWNGDLVATDQESLNSWTTTMKHDETTFEDDLSQLERILRTYNRWFTKNYATEGNHDDRIARATGGEVNIGMLLPRDLIEYSQYAYLYIKTSKRGWIKVCHPQNFSSNPVNLGEQLYNVERGPEPGKLIKTHIVLGHCHRAQSGFSPDGHYQIMASGMMRDDLRTTYKMKSSNKHKQWDPGFIVLKDGILHNLSLHGTDWKYWLGELYNPDLMDSLLTSYQY